jgi:hypothetical protein
MGVSPLDTLVALSASLAAQNGQGLAIRCTQPHHDASAIWCEERVVMAQTTSQFPAIAFNLNSEVRGGFIEIP